MSAHSEQHFEFFLDSSLVAEIAEDTPPVEPQFVVLPSTETGQSSNRPMLPTADSLRNLNGLPTDPFRAAEMAIELQVERMKVAEALSARDAVVQRFANAYSVLPERTSSHEDSITCNAPSPADPVVPASGNYGATAEGQRLNDYIAKQEVVIKRLSEELRNTTMKLTAATKTHLTASDPPPYEDNTLEKPIQADGRSPFVRSETACILWSSFTSFYLLFLMFSQTTLLNPSIASDTSTPPDATCNNEDETPVMTIKSSDPVQRIKARNDMLAVLPLPVEGPHDDLEPIIIPAPFTLHEFVATSSSYLRNSLSNYRILQELTTSWCPSREEHGYFLTPAFKCSTNPRVTTAHRWSMVDVLNKLGKPTDCFYHKDGCWYYAGIYKAFRMEDLSPKEWEALSNETASALVRETICARKNTSPQNIYEITQLYAAGALRVACIGLQCVGFNRPLFHSLLDHASTFAHNAPAMAKWRSGSSSGSLPNTPGIPTPVHSPAPNVGGNVQTAAAATGFPWGASLLAPTTIASEITERMACIAITPGSAVTGIKEGDGTRSASADIGDANQGGAHRLKRNGTYG